MSSKYDTMTETQKADLEVLVIQKAENFWDKMFPKKEGTIVDKLRLISRQGVLNTGEQAKAAMNYFLKEGLWSDGKTPIEEAVKQLSLRKMKFGKKVSDINSSYLKDIESSEQKIKELKEKLQTEPQKQRQAFNTKKNDLIRKEMLEYEESSKRLIDQTHKEMDGLIDKCNKTIDKYQSAYEAKIKESLLDFQRRQKQTFLASVANYGAELETELILLDNKAQDDEKIARFTDKIKEINKEITQLEASIVLPDKPKKFKQNTIAELKEIAIEKGIEVPIRILKDDLIRLIEGSE